MNRPSLNWGTILLVPIISACAAGELNHSQNAKAIIDRPGRVSIEHSAWHPAEVKPIKELLQPSLKLRPNYPVTEAKLPDKAGVGRLFWMDNQFVITTIISKESGSDKNRIQILNSTDGTLADYKSGQLDCYQDGKIIYHSGPATAFMQPENDGGKYFIGAIGSEKEHPVWIKADERGDARQFTFNVNRCDALEDPVSATLTATPIGDTFDSKVAGKPVPVWAPLGLLPQHGFLALHRPTRQAYPASLLSHYAVHWFKPADGKPVKLDVAWPEEVEFAGLDNWAPWLGKYVLSGTSLRYSKAPQRIETTLPRESTLLAAEGNVTLFDPKDGSLTKISRPSAFLNQVQIFKAFATRAGILWQSHTQAPWGVYLSAGNELMNIAPLHISEISVSPNGCHAALKYYSKSGDFSSTKKINFIHFC